MAPRQDGGTKNSERKLAPLGNTLVILEQSRVNSDVCVAPGAVPPEDRGGGRAQVHMYGVSLN